MSRALVCVLTAAWSLGISGQTVHQPEQGVNALEGAAVTLDCSYDIAGNSHYIIWYKQEVNSLPDFILSADQFGYGKNAEKFGKRFHCSMVASARQAPLRIERVKPSDSGVFYCALKTTLTHPLACLHKNSCNRLISSHTLGVWPHRKKWVKLSQSCNLAWQQPVFVLKEDIVLSRCGPAGLKTYFVTH